MNESKLKIRINRPSDELFDFILDPLNTPRWIDGIVKEETNESPTRLGTVFRNQNLDGKWNEYKVTAFKPGLVFTLSQKNSDYHVTYTITPLGKSSELEYFEWVDKGELEEPLAPVALQKLQAVMEHLG
jgi:hypothetical protein